MGENETLTLSVHHPASQPIRELPFNFHRLVDGSETYHGPLHNTSYPSPRMEHEAYARHYGVAHYPEPPQAVGLGIQYVSLQLKHQVSSL
jgi:hypothetical protein